jgi:hypothetical protein
MYRTIACSCLAFAAAAAHGTTLVDGNTRVMLGRYTTTEAEPAKAMFLWEVSVMQKRRFMLPICTEGKSS